MVDPACACSSSVATGGSTCLGVWAVPLSNGAVKSLYSAFHLAGVASLGLPYFCCKLAFPYQSYRT